VTISFVTALLIFVERAWITVFVHAGTPSGHPNFVKLEQADAIDKEVFGVIAGRQQTVEKTMANAIRDLGEIIEASR
jgi:hypothetical protein